MKLSVVLSVLNEQNNLRRVLSSVPFADEIIVVDNQSTDKTVIIAKQFKAKIYSRPNNIMLNLNKNYGFTKAIGDWILNLDADEEIDEVLKTEILQNINKNQYEGFWIPRKNIIWGKWIKHSLWWPDYQLRLFKNGKGKFPCEHVHEALSVTGQTEYLKNPLLHYNYNTVSQFLFKLDKIYTENEVERFLKSEKKLVWTDALKMPFEDFLKTFFAKKGYLDGLHGLVLSLMQAFYQEVLFAKIWERQNFSLAEPEKLLPAFKEEVKKIKHDYNYWENTEVMENTISTSAKIFFRLKRKFHL